MSLDEQPLMLIDKQRAEIHESIAYALRTLKHLRGSVALRHLEEVAACRERLHKALFILELSQGSQALPDHDEH